MAYNLEKDNILDQMLKDYFGTEFFRPGINCLENSFKAFNQVFKSKKYKIITIAGTNGKGQTSHYLNDLLTDRGFKCALWTSPHVLSVTERFKISGNYISHDLLLETFKEVFKEDLSFTYYEFLFFCFCRICEQRDLDYILLEVGLGGRLDSVNMLDADLTLLTSISKDHEEYLGSDLFGILKEKLGITRAGVKHISSIEREDLRSSQKLSLEQQETPFIDLFENGVLNISDNYSLRNQILASFAFHELTNGDLKRETLIENIKNFECSVTKGRQEEVTIGEIKFIFIGAHNVDGLRKTRNYFLSEYNEPNLDGLICAFSKRPQEDIELGLSILKSAPSPWKSIYVTEFEHVKAMSIDTFTICDGIIEARDWQKLLETLIKKERGQWIVTGSYYFIGEVQKYLIHRYNSLEL